MSLKGVFRVSLRSAAQSCPEVLFRGVAQKCRLKAQKCCSEVSVGSVDEQCGSEVLNTSVDQKCCAEVSL